MVKPEEEKVRVGLYPGGMRRNLRTYTQWTLSPVKGAQRIYEIVIKSALLNKLSWTRPELTVTPTLPPVQRSQAYFFRHIAARARTSHLFLYM